MNGLKKMLRGTGLVFVMLVGLISIIGKTPAPPPPPPPTKITYTTSCGVGQFTFEPPPAIQKPGVGPPSGVIYKSIITNAHCISPGSTISVAHLTEAYPSIQTITKLELVIFRRHYDPTAIGSAGPSYPGVVHLIGAQEYYDITSFTRTSDGNFTATIPYVIDQPPTAASIRMTYTVSNGASFVVDLERDRASDSSTGYLRSNHGLFFVPNYKVYLAVAKVSIGWNVADQTINSSTFPNFSAVYAHQWEEYCRIRKIEIANSGFPGTIGLTHPHVLTRNPDQGYQVQMPSTRSGHFSMKYQVVCPENLEPSGSSLFNSWGTLGNYTGNLEKGMPAITQGNIEFPTNLWID